MEIDKAIESYEAEIRELNAALFNLRQELNEERFANKAHEREINRLQGMVEAFEICVKARK